MSLLRTFRVGLTTGARLIRRRQLAAAASSSSKDKDPTPSSFALNLFTGKLVLDEVFPFPEALSEEGKETLGLLVDPLTKFYEEVNDAAKNDQNEKVSDEVMDAVKKMGGFGMQIPSDLGGLGLTNSQYARLGEISGGYDLGLSIVMGAHQSIGFKGILLYGNEEQKKKYLPRLASGELIAAYCLTEPTSGSDAQSIRCKAELSPDKKHYILNGSKLWISNGVIADVFTVFAQTPLGENQENKITAFIVERNFEGVSNGPPEKKMGIKASTTAAVYFDNVKIPVENVLLEPGDGFKIAMNILNNGRFGMAAAMTGTMKALIQRASDHVSQRVQFGSTLDSYGSIQSKIAKMALQAYVTESIAYMISANMDKGAEEFQLEAAISKIYGSEAAWNVADECIQIHGGMGFMTDAGLERVLRDLRIFRIFEGTNDILRLFIALTGFMHAGKQLRGLAKAIQNPFSNPSLVFAEGTKRAKNAFGLATTSSLTQFTHPDLKKPSDQATAAISKFGITAQDLVVKYKKDIIHQQILLTQIADAAIDIYAMVSVLSRATRSLKLNLPSAEHETKLCTIFCDEASERVLTNLKNAKSAQEQQKNDVLKDIAKEVVEKGHYVPVHPLEV
ncbi:very long-chain specific acyl-CoA dehydrogenase, mitochondrial-like [Oscarella lobularis]|uniref:very long-chain specific acyl-CoA dehydrogenase, mitochondrial-like n=1 Tax=Oscarella lobularis TaxID=121494 RepID=UPI003313716A